MIDDFMPAPIELGGQCLFRYGHADGIGDALPQRACGGFNTRRIAIFGMAWSLGMELAEILQFLLKAGRNRSNAIGNKSAWNRGHWTTQNGHDQPIVGLLGLCCMWSFQSTSAMSAMPIGAPGCPEFAFCTASMLKARMAFAKFTTRSHRVIS